MKLAGIRSAEGHTVVVRLGEGGLAYPVADLATFWADPHRCLASAATAPETGQPLSGQHVVPPVSASARVICVGLNYHAHAAEGSFTVPAHPTLFGRWTASLTAGGVPAPVPAGEDGLDWRAKSPPTSAPRCATPTRTPRGPQFWATPPSTISPPAAPRS